jgi:nucleoside-diphosphate-sugar epimerase
MSYSDNENSKLKILVSGAAGFLGQHLIPALLSSGHSVRAVIRSRSSKPPPWIDQVEPVYADLVEDRLDHAFDEIDVTIHLAGAAAHSEKSATQRFLSAMALSPVKRLIHVSSFAVYDWSLATDTLDENTPIITNFDDVGAYASSKVRQEQLVLDLSKANGWDTTILRPGYIWGRDHAELAGMGRRWGRFYVMFGPFMVLPLIHVANCADLIVKIAERNEIGHVAFNAIDESEIRVWRYVYENIKRTRHLGLMIPLPYWVGYMNAVLAAKLGRAMFGAKTLPSLLTPRQFEMQFKPLKFSKRRTHKVLKWYAPFDFETCLDLTYRRTTPPER